MRTTIGLICAVIALAGAAEARPKDRPLSIDEAIQHVGRRSGGFEFATSSAGFELQVWWRLTGILYEGPYKYLPGHSAKWKSCMLDENQNMYARLCAAYFLSDEDKEAREFLESHVASKNLRYRYNAAKAVEMYVSRDPSKTWGVNLLIQRLSDGSLDGGGVHSTPPGDYPDGDASDIMGTPLDSICWDLGCMKEKKAVPALISALQRKPDIGGAAFALGEIGDTCAIPILITILKERPGYRSRDVVRALGMLKAKDAVPVLVSRLGEPKRTGDSFDIMETNDILEALLAIGDKRAVPPIEEFLSTGTPGESEPVARRVLAQMTFCRSGRVALGAACERDL